MSWSWVDDGSSDGSLDTLREHVGKIAGLRVVELYKNSGQVAALSAGMSVARGRYVVMMDGDLQHDPADVRRLFDLAREGHDLVATYRRQRQDTLLRRLVTWSGNRINRALTGLPIRDFGSAYRMIDAPDHRPAERSPGLRPTTTPPSSTPVPAVRSRSRSPSIAAPTAPANGPC